MTATKKATKKTTGHTKEGLRDGQVRILQVLSKLAPQAGLTRKNIADKALNGHMGWAFNHIGPTDEGKRKKTEKRTGFPCLLTLKAVSTTVVQSDEGAPKERIYRITATGRSMLEKALKAEAERERAEKDEAKAKAKRQADREKARLAREKAEAKAAAKAKANKGKK